MARRGFGKIAKQRSGRWQASYVHDGRRHYALETFDAKGYADEWLAAQQTDIARGTWGKPAPKASAAAPTFAEYAARVIERRASNGLRRSTERKYRGELAGHLAPAFGATRIDQVTAAQVNDWYYSYGRERLGARANAYRLLSTVMKAAIREGLRESSPCQVPGGGTDPKRARESEAITYEQADELAAAMRPEWRMLVLLAAYCQLRFGELAELRRRDIELDPAAGRGVIRVRRAVTRVDGVAIVGPPKSRAGVRDVAVPGDLLGELAEHLAEHTGPGRDALLFTTRRGGQLTQSATWHEWNLARTAAGLPGFRFHDLRHTGITWLAREGATVKERMYRAGHDDHRMVTRYEHADAERDAANAERLSRRRAGVVVPLAGRRARTSA
jgi:integrase